MKHLRFFNLDKKRINTSIVLLLIFLLLVPANIFLANPRTKVLKPKNSSTKVSIIISGKSKTYYPLSNKEATIVTAKGPGKLKIITRAQFKSQSKNTMDYTISYRVDGVEKIKMNFENVKQDIKVVYAEKSLGFPGSGEEIIIDLGRGEHSIELWRGDENLNVCSRFLFTEVKEKKIDWVPLGPSYPNKPVNLITNEDVATYYRYSADKPLEIKITGPTILRVLNRIENDYQMKGRINYRIQVKEDAKIKNTYLLSSIRSDVTKYKNDGGKIPGKANEIIINVPGGTHTYQIITLDKDKNTVLARVLFPKKDVKLEE